MKSTVTHLTVGRDPLREIARCLIIDGTCDADSEVTFSHQAADAAAVALHEAAAEIDRLRSLLAPPAGARFFQPESPQYVDDAVTIDRLRAENETLRLMYAEMVRRNEVLKEWQREACEEFEDIRCQWGSDYLWEKHNEKPVVDLLRRAGVNGDDVACGEVDP